MVDTAGTPSANPTTRTPVRKRDPRVMLLAGLLILAVFYTLYFIREIIKRRMTINLINRRFIQFPRFFGIGRMNVF